MIQAKIIELNPKDAAARYYNYMKSYNSKWKTYITQCVKYRNFVFGNQFDDDEIAQMESRGQYPVSINRSQKYVYTMAGMFSSGEYLFKAAPEGIEDESVSEICNKIFNYVFKRSMGTVIIQKALMAGLADNMGYAHIKQNDQNQTVISFLPVEQVVVDSDSKDPYFRDAKVIYIHRWISVEDVQSIYNIKTEDLCTLVPPTFNNYYYSYSGERTMVEPIVSNDKKRVLAIEGYYRKIERIYKTGEDGSKIWNGETKVVMTKETLLGYAHCFVETLPPGITEHCVVPFYMYDTLNTFKLGAMSRLYDYQRLLNKSMVTMLLNAQLSSNPKLLLWEDTIPNSDITSFEDNYAVAGSVSMLSGNGKNQAAPIVIQGQPLSAAWLNLTQLLGTEMEFAAMPNQMMGLDTNQNVPKDHLYQQYEFVLNSMRTFINIYNGALACVAKSVLQYFLAYSRRYLKKAMDLDKIEGRLKIYEQNGFSEDPQKMQAKMQEMIEQKSSMNLINIEVIKYNKLLSYKQNIDYITQNPEFIDIDITVIKDSYLPSASLHRFNRNLELYKMQLIDNETLMQDAPIENKEEVIEKVSTIRQQASQITNLEDTIADMQSQIKQLTQQLQDSMINAVVLEHGTKLNKIEMDARTKERATYKVNTAYQSVEHERKMLDITAKSNQALLELKKALNELNLEKKKVNSKVESEDALKISNSNIINDLY